MGSLRIRGLKPPSGRGSYAKDMFFNLYQRNSSLKLHVVEETAVSLKRFIYLNVHEGSIIYTDDYSPYRLLEAEG